MLKIRQLILCSVLAGLFLTGCAHSPADPSLAEKESHVVGRLNGTVQPLPGFFRNNNTLTANRDFPEFLGFRFTHSQSGRRVTIRPGHSGFFSRSLEPGTWTFERHRRDRPTGEGPEVLEIMTFDVPKSSLVNLGTFNIVLEGEPEETLFLSRRRDQGTYIYTYHYERGEGADDFAWPVDHLRDRDSDTLKRFQDNIVEIRDPVTTGTDQSQFRFRVYNR